MHRKARTPAISLATKPGIRAPHDGTGSEEPPLGKGMGTAPLVSSLIRIHHPSPLRISQGKQKGQFTPSRQVGVN